MHPDLTTGRPTARAFWVFAAIYGLFMAAASAPSPLYGVYATRFDFPASTLTAVFAVYAIALLAALLTTGRLSDHLGRRPVVLAAVAGLVAAMLCLALADSTAALFLGRALQGLATGAALGALSAGIIDLGDTAPGMAPVVTGAAPAFGLAVGAIASSALVQYAPAPLHLVYWVIIAALAVGAAAVLASPEPGRRRPGALRSLAPVAAVPAHTRPTFAALAPSIVAAWALNGFYLALGPGLIAEVEGSANHLWGGVAILTFTATAGVTGLLARRVPIRTALVTGPATLAAGALLSLLAITAGSGALFLVGSAVAGGGFGVAFLAGIRSISDAARPHERAGVLASFYTLSYLAFSVPVVIAGIAQAHSGARPVAIAFSAAVAASAALGALAALPRRHRAAPTTK